MCHQLNHLPQDFGHVARVMVKDPICVDEGHQDSVSVVLLSRFSTQSFLGECCIVVFPKLHFKIKQIVED